MMVDENKAQHTFEIGGKKKFISALLHARLSLTKIQPDMAIIVSKAFKFFR
jgi:hypothetical protein